MKSHENSLDFYPSVCLNRFMLKKIKLKNFMSHRDSELELSKGVNVLIGPNNSGKSAVVSALQLLAEIPLREGPYMIRHGESESQVIVETDSGDEIIWGRKHASSYLIINGKKHTRLSNNQEHFLNELHQVLKLPRVKNKEEAFDIHFALQKEPIFLLDEPPSRAATFFSISSDAGRLVEVRELFKTKVNRAKEKRSALLRRKSTLLQELNQLEPLRALEIPMMNLKSEFETLQKDEGRIREGGQLLNDLKKCVAHHNTLILKHDLYQEVLPLPLLEPVSELENVMAQMRFLNAKKVKLEQYLASLEKLEAPPMQEEESQSLEKTISLLSHLSKRERDKNNSYIVLEQLLPPCDQQESSSIEKLWQSLIVANHRFRLYQSKWDSISTLGEPPVMETPAPLTSDLERCITYQEKMHSLLKKSKESASRLRQWISDHPTCPTCGVPFNSEHLSGDSNHE
jgi:DNA repair ATPase RecN